MQNIRTILCFLFLSVSVVSKAQDDQTIRQYINTYKEAAIAEMQRTGVPASIKLAQGIHETTAGTSVLVLKSNNHFGIKCKSDWTGESVSHTDDAPNECFRKYNDPLDSYRDHSNFLKNGPRYASLFKLDPLDYTDWAYGLKKAGYATNPKYPQVIIKLIEDYNLQEYTLIALGKASPKDELQAKITDEKKEDAITSSPQTTFINDIAIKIPAEEKKEPKSEIIPVEKNKKPGTEERIITEPVVVKPAIAEIRNDYPRGEFKINETRVTYVKKGTSFLSIAEQYNIPLARIFEFNDNLAATEAAETDQLIYLQRKRRTGNNEFHIVRPGETLMDIARDEAIRIESLMEYNFLGINSKPATGEQLYLRSKAPAAPLLVK
ncbi:MAG: glucosaminidase domain-containing protein [Chitinophagaceae bacterium]